MAPRPPTPLPSSHRPESGTQAGVPRRAPEPTPPDPATAAPAPRPVALADVATMADALAYLSSRVDLERTRRASAVQHAYKLDRMRALCRALGEPQHAVRCVHVAGTKGKGSTCEMIAACLEACGYTVGCYTSPHLVDIRERVRINRRPIPEADFVESLRAVASTAESLAPSMGEATFFELLTALGFHYFAQQAVDVSVIEVGLGGLLDCTNVVSPEVAAVALIGLDHTDILGRTIEQIAAQKGGIYKPGVPALTYEQDPAAVEVLRRCAAEVQAPFQVVGRDIDFSYRYEHQPPTRTSPGGPQAFVNLATDQTVFEHVPVPLPGEHQAANAGLALAVLSVLGERGFTCPPELVTRGMESVRLPGRFELISRSPRILLDGAHNPESIQALMKTISLHLPTESMVCVFGCGADKEIAPMLRHLASGADKVIFTRAGGWGRAAAPADLQRRFDAISGGKMSQVCPEPAAALEAAVRAVDRDGLICVTGSFYLVGEIKRRLQGATARAR
jgi:dihydrofolate synthase/folylpolyglutamate synthase